MPAGSFRISLPSLPLKTSDKAAIVAALAFVIIGFGYLQFQQETGVSLVVLVTGALVIVAMLLSRDPLVIGSILLLVVGLVLFQARGDQQLVEWAYELRRQGYELTYTPCSTSSLASSW